MKKRLLSVALCSVMVMSLFACGSNGEESTTPAKKDNESSSATTTVAEATTTVKPVTTEEEAITKDPIYSEDFNGENPKITVVYHENYNPDTGAPAAAMIPTADAAVAAGKTALIQTTESKDGSNALELDGTYGATLDVTFADGTDSYTLSFWVNEQRLGQYGTLATIGKDLLATNNDCSWLSITMTQDWLGYQIAPVIWSRSMKASLEVDPTGDADGNGVQADNVWPWYAEAYCAASEESREADFAKKEWHHVVVVVDGSQTGRDPVLVSDVAGTVQGTTYIDGQLWGTGPVANYIVDSTTQVFMGINCWDLVTKAYYDDIAVYDYALTAGQVFGLYNAQKGE